MQKQQISFTSSPQNYHNPIPFTTGTNITNYNLPDNQTQQTTVNPGSRVQGQGQVYETSQQSYQTSQQVYGTVQQVSRRQTYTTVNQVQQRYVGTLDNYGYGYSETGYQQSGERKQANLGTTGAAETYQQNTTPPVIYQETRYVDSRTGGSGVKGGSFVGQQSSASFARPAQTVQAGSIIQPASYVPQQVTYTQPQTVTSYAQPQTYTHQVQSTYQPLQHQASGYISTQQNANKWVQQEFQRPKYPKLYNNSAEYYRNLAPEDDPTVKKTCCSPCCWVLVGLLGLMAVVFGVLCGLGIFCGGSINFPPASPAGTAATANVATPVEPVTPTGPQQPVVSVDNGTQPVTQVTPIIGGSFDDTYIHPSTTPKVPITSSSTDTWSSTTSGTTSSTTGTTASSAYGPTYIDPSTTGVAYSYMDPSRTNKIPIYTTTTTPLPTTTTTTYNTYPTTTGTYGYDLGYTPATTQPDASSVPLVSGNADAWTPMSVQPTTAEISSGLAPAAA